jgi:hypothetical protein
MRRRAYGDSVSWYEYGDMNVEIVLAGMNLELVQASIIRR